jgi:hypothetical protein
VAFGSWAAAAAAAETSSDDEARRLRPAPAPAGAGTPTARCGAARAAEASPACRAAPVARRCPVTARVAAPRRATAAAGGAGGDRARRGRGCGGGGGGFAFPPRGAPCSGTSSICHRGLRATAWGHFGICLVGGGLGEARKRAQRNNCAGGESQCMSERGACGTSKTTRNRNAQADTH